MLLHRMVPSMSRGLADRRFSAGFAGWRNRRPSVLQRISTHNVTYNAGSHRSLPSSISRASWAQVVLCKLHTHHIL
jgi:hypothetical protein